MSNTALDLPPLHAVPRTPGQMKSALLGEADRIARAFEKLEPTAFVAPQGNHWSAAQHLGHIEWASRTVAGANVPAAALLLLHAFGPRIRPEWSADSLRERYQEALALTQAPAAFRPRDPKPGDPTPEFQAKALDTWRQTLENLAQQGPDLSALGPAPHARPAPPVLGKITIWEVLVFAPTAQRHHLARFEQRAACARHGPVPPGGGITLHCRQGSISPTIRGVLRTARVWD
ncbi:MAG: DinB family protein [Planctomycetota bacterium]